MSQGTSTDTTGTPASEESREVPVVESSELLGSRQQLHIRHGEHVYTLRRTSQDKLILTK